MQPCGHLGSWGKGDGKGQPGAGNRWEAVRKTWLRHVLRVEGRQEDVLGKLTVVVWGRGLAQPYMEAVASEGSELPVTRGV